MRFINIMYPRAGTIELEEGAFVWRGNQLLARITSEALYCAEEANQLKYREDMIIRIGDFAVRQLMDARYTWTIFLIRDDWRAPFVVFFDRLFRTLDLVNISLIRVFHIWNLANKEEGETYHWGNLNVAKWIGDKCQRLKRPNT